MSRRNAQFRYVSAGVQTVLLTLAIASFLFPEADAAGSGLNTIIVANANSRDSCELATHYQEQRHLPPDHVLRINWNGGNTGWSDSDFTNVLLNPLLSRIANSGLHEQINCIVLSKDIPFQTIQNQTNFNSTTAALYYGFKTIGSNTSNSYVNQELEFSIFRTNGSPTTPGFLCTMLTGNSLADAKALVDRAVAGDNKQPAQKIVLAKTSDPLRNLRASLFEDVAIDATILGAPGILITNSDQVIAVTNLLGYATGLAEFDAAPNSFVPGAIADSVTSFGGIIFGPNTQTNLLNFLEAGATGSYGTVAEPAADLNKFPVPRVYFYQARGFSLAESYYQSIQAPYLGLIVGEPHSAPFARRGFANWGKDSETNAVLQGNEGLHINFTAASASHPLDAIALYVDGKFLQVLTNVPPTPGNTLHLNVNGYPLDFVVPTNTTIGSIASELADSINAAFSTNASMITATAHGDRIELLSLATNHATFPFFLAAPYSPTSQYRVSYLTEATPPTLQPARITTEGAFRLNLAIPTPLQYTVEASTNLYVWSPIWTNSASGFIEFEDHYASNYSQRFYRIQGPSIDAIPTISLTTQPSNSSVFVQIESLAGQPCAILASTNGIDWLALSTNHAGAKYDYLDNAPSIMSQRFYRAWLVSLPLPQLTVTNLNPATDLIRVDAASRPYVIQTFSNSIWQGIFTNYGFQDIQITTDSSSPGVEPRTTFLTASRPRFLKPDISGRREYTFLAATLTTNAWAQFIVTKTNGQTVMISFTNLVANLNATNLAFNFYNAINQHSSLQGPDGIVAEDFRVISGQSRFVLRPRSAGYAAAQISVAVLRSSFATGVAVFPWTNLPVTENLSDLQPRNHLYVTAGTASLHVDFTLDTTQFADGYHELTAVAFEGSHVRTQTHSSIPICISNSPLTATLTLLDLTNNAPVNGVYHLFVSANTNDVSRTTLYSTGGALAATTNLANSVFTVPGTNLWAGLHPFYALVETASGLRYRTETTWVRLQ